MLSPEKQIRTRLKRYEEAAISASFFTRSAKPMFLLGCIGLLLFLMPFASSLYRSSLAVLLSFGFLYIPIRARIKAKKQYQSEEARQGALALLDEHSSGQGSICLLNQGDCPPAFLPPVEAQAKEALKRFDEKTFLPTPRLSRFLCWYAAFFLLMAVPMLARFLHPLIYDEGGLAEQTQDRLSAAIDNLSKDEKPAEEADKAAKAEEDSSNEASEVSEGGSDTESAGQAKAQPSDEGMHAKPEEKLIDLVHPEELPPEAKKKHQEEEAKANPKAQTPEESAPKAGLSEEELKARKEAEKEEAKEDYPNDQKSGNTRPSRAPLEAPKEEPKPFDQVEKRVRPKNGKGATKSIRALKEVAAAGLGQEGESARQIGGVPKDAKAPKRLTRAHAPMTKEEAAFLERWRK